MARRFVRLVLVLTVIAFVGADEPAGSDVEKADSKQLAADKTALSKLQTYVGEWKGVGQLRRGSNQAAWTETAEWRWDFAESRASLFFSSPQGKYYTDARLRPGDKAGSFELIATRPNGKTRDRFTGRVVSDQLVLTAAEDDPPRGDDFPARITIRLVADGDRLITLFERRSAGSQRYTRLAEVGATRQGSSFGQGGTGQPECVVTGGLGTIKVEHEGQTYYVCCTGCRDLFNDDPEGVLAEYRERKAKEREKKKAKS